MPIINFSVNENRLFNFENRVTYYLGKISYGIYMYHTMAVALSIKLLMYFNVFNNVSVYILGPAMTIAFSILSYEFFEQRFIKMKIRFSRIVTGDNVEERGKGEVAAKESELANEVSK